MIQLIGMLDSPYVRRVAISLRLLGIPFEHRAVSVFSTFEQFRQINPVVKAPSLVCDNNEVLMDSSLILDYAEAIAYPRKSLMPSNLSERQHTLRIIGLALAACEKSIQIIYERNLRPNEKQHQPWIDRVRGQVTAAYAALEKEFKSNPPKSESPILMQSDITSAVAWQFTQMMLPEIISEDEHPTLRAFSEKAELLPEFLAFPPIGPGVPTQN
ncbi:glutathione S-transferase [Leptospira sp. WS92.C1]